jgi:hypothetical protein
MTFAPEMHNFDGSIRNMVGLDNVPVVSANVIGRNLNDEAVLVDTTNAQIKVVNQVGAYIWSLVDGIRSVREIAHQVYLVYEIDEAQSEEDTLDFFANLSQRGLVKLT